ncbi:dicarboxylate/amino acid:cation symporter [Halalkalibacterium halodurans]|uniref:H(+)/sodium-glutamate symporter n=1 Tax=Halalkalibacterium halodurans (strain ATCC BAA-125 / DSM 18197 / FERM 7344 / JCM 9153 / C-125) TaxID=272558 RepID=Q9K6A9_HALH5|nr:dicarboxylate/amino acid:cation symporter [Halalkalibacterium halodurans]MDY7224324.1 dicarboxylate/amino acid:cation symporter [Halalkalibacterium halodurans]MDY7243609.1 dicarboxylate/amino acid:cation symporter [Halalkalibacterium halodurans]MED3646476.1 dicarboxylate/amino acid:cation symporter [Halalkalibacterium halodurans]MED4079529.1 dicarboxylate/amino acid:cation symporter [Halalkalibacterium halodurans]MED4084194.1 dicarboxylate/amino acid:cation symporter [Halalkalibacterium hal
MSLTKKIIIALVLGILVGLGMNKFAPDLFVPIDTYVFTPVGQLFLRLIMMLVVPLVLFSIILGTAGLGDPKKLGKLGSKTVGFYLLTTMIALVIGLSIAYVLQPGEPGLMGTVEEEFEATEAPPVMETILNIIPRNPIEALASGQMLQIIAFAVLVGLALGRLGEKTSGILKLVEQGNEVMMYLVSLAMKLAPYGAFGLIASALGKLGFDALGSMAMYVIAVLLALLLHAVITYGGFLAFVAKRNPLEFLRNFFPAMALAFGTSSSSAVLPVSMKTAQEKLGVSKPVSSFVQPLGATINMDGTAIMQAVATVFIAQVYAQQLSMGDLLTVVLTATLASIGTAGVPGVGLIMLAMVLQSIGLPVEGIALVLAVDRILDMSRTAINITGDATCAVVIDESEKRSKAKAASTSASA